MVASLSASAWSSARSTASSKTFAASLSIPESLIAFLANFVASLADPLTTFEAKLSGLPSGSELCLGVGLPTCIHIVKRRVSHAQGSSKPTFLITFFIAFLHSLYVHLAQFLGEIVLAHMQAVKS